MGVGWGKVKGGGQARAGGGAGGGGEREAIVFAASALFTGCDIPWPGRRRLARQDGMPIIILVY